MKITRLAVENFKAIERIEMQAIEDMVVIAGPNGCGKSCILDSIRLVKSLYGGYVVNEWQQWTGEFLINLQHSKWEMKKVLRDKEKQSAIEINIRIEQEELDYLKERKQMLMEELAWQKIMPKSEYGSWKQRIKAKETKANWYEHQVSSLAASLTEDFSKRLHLGPHTGRIEIAPDGQPVFYPNTMLETIWRIYNPPYIGLVDYHGAHRNYARELIGGINLNLKTQEDQQKQHALYNYGNKYTNIKTEMAGEFIRQTLKEKSGIQQSDGQESLANTLRELFKIFFPEKQFEGAKVNAEGELEFPVTIDGNNKHDINELSSGEKEVLFGYLRLRNSAPRYSVILLDEPELHLNPRLIQGLPQFYQRHLGEKLKNQIWLVTHSDAFLRESMASPDIGVYHMQEPETGEDNQIRKIEEKSAEERAVLEMVGDIAGYKPGGKIVIFEGANSEFDKRMTSRLFPKYEKRMNFISGGNRKSVEKLHSILEMNKGGIRVYSIVDKDSGKAKADGKRTGRFSWNVYHIENYLMESQYILDVLRNSTISDTPFQDTEEVEEELKIIAKEQVQSLVAHSLMEEVNHGMVTQISTRIDPNAENLCEKIHEAVNKSSENLKEEIETNITLEKLGKKATKKKLELENSLKNDQWKEEFKGRDIMREFVRKHGQGMKYERFRDSIVNAMAERRNPPKGMANVLRQIDEDSPN